MLTQLLNFDSQITGLFSFFLPHNVFFDYFFSFFSLQGNSILVWVIVILFVLFLEERKYPGISKQDKKFAVLFLLAFLTTTFIVELPLKNFFQRPRPYFETQYLKANKYSCPKDFSFPSGHASTAFAAAAILTFFDKKRRGFYFTIAILIACSRLYLGCHYFFDVIIGAFLGYYISKFFLYLSKKYSLL